MREIKFRALCTDNNKYITGFNMYGFSNYKSCNKSIERFNSKWEDNFILEQFTGLKDKNDREIYEGDKVRILYTDWPSNTDDNISLEDYKISISHIGAVEWRNDLAYYVIRWDEYNSGSIHHGTHGEIEIIGNIHE